MNYPVFSLCFLFPTQCLCTQSIFSSEAVVQHKDIFILFLLLLFFFFSALGSKERLLSCFQRDREMKEFLRLKLGWTWSVSEKENVVVISDFWLKNAEAFGTRLYFFAVNWKSPDLCCLSNSPSDQKVWQTTECLNKNSKEKTKAFHCVQWTDARGIWVNFDFAVVCRIVIFWALQVFFFLFWMFSDTFVLLIMWKMSHVVWFDEYLSIWLDIKSYFQRIQVD